MSQSVQLIPLLCPRCQAPIPAQVDEIAWVCEQCGQAALLDEEHGAKAIDVFFSTAVPQNGTGRPYWVGRARVNIANRLTYRGDQSREMNQFWSQGHLFYLPAWQAEIGDLVAAGVKLVREPARMEAGARCRFLPVVLPQRDVLPLAEFIVMSIEAERSDALRELNFKVQMDPLQLWILP